MLPQVAKSYNLFAISIFKYLTIKLTTTAKSEGN